MKILITLLLSFLIANTSVIAAEISLNVYTPTEVKFNSAISSDIQPKTNQSEFQSFQISAPNAKLWYTLPGTQQVVCLISINQTPPSVVVRAYGGYNCNNSQVSPNIFEVKITK